MTIAAINHVELDEKGRAFIAGGVTRVALIVMDQMNGLTPQAILKSYPHLSMSQIHAALAYYYDHTNQIDAEIAAEVADIQKHRQQSVQPTRSELESRFRLAMQ